MKIWLDDTRLCPDDFDYWVRTARECIDLLSEHVKRNDIYLSFDHDLGASQNGTGYDVAKWIEEYAYFNKIKKISWDIHSQNPVGVKAIEYAMKNAELYWKTNDRIFISIEEPCDDCDSLDFPGCNKCIGS
jgi:hypothetical protein